MPAINYAAQYAQALAQAFPYSLNFGALYATPNNNRYRMGEDGKTVYIPNLSTTGRVAADRDTIATATRNYDNAWEPKTLKNQRKWSTLVHPKDIDQTNEVASITNITQTFNEEQKFPEMDAYCVSEIYKLWTEEGHVADHTELTTANVLAVFDELMLKMDNARVPANGRILYCTNEVKTMLKQASGITRNFDVQSGGNVVNRSVSRIEEVEVIGVPSTLMRTEYDFSAGWRVADGADQINMLLIHPAAVITPVSYQFSQLDPPSAVTEGKYIYYEESFEDVFILNKKSDAIQFNTSIEYVGGLTVTSAPNASTSGSTDISVSPASAGTGYKYYYRTGANVVEVHEGEVISTSGTNAWTELTLSSGDATLTGQTTGDYLTVVRAKTSSMAVDKEGHVVIAAKA